MNQFIKLTFQKRILYTGLKVSLIVGVILNVINQGDTIVSLNYSKINFLKLILTFVVPFVVSVYSSAQTKRVIQKENQKKE